MLPSDDTAPGPAAPTPFPPPPPPAPQDPAAPRFLPVPEIVENVEYHRLNLARGRRPRWWRPLLVALLGLALYIGMIIVLVVPFAFAAAFVPEVMQVISRVAGSGGMDMTDPATFVVAMLSIILLLPALLIASRVIAGRGLGLLSSVTGRLRWGWMLRCLGLAAAVFALQTAISMTIALLQGEDLIVTGAAPQPWPMLLLVILLVPLQSATEEYVFRGFLMQTIGSWLKHPAFAILLPLPLFVFGHLYDVWGLLSVAAFALAAGWLTWRTGGLEAGIALHVVNNVSIFVLASFGLADANSSGGGPLDLLVSVLVLAVTVGVLEWMQRRTSIARTRTLRWHAPVVPPQG
ncbi:MULTISPECIES: CPBP family intramembrane glutamic endopeptidase [unclassified Microbacterium]|uniref:CPBP family intramembrane glutamic endopeptidase n=1 Tax=unclassified Microbacterium TaxID=2609290 RepID=UPI0012F8F9EF|nr:type II CAAX endopeptidase family protein [Microbacterium sp. MAH-37]MVQ40976.1 CPBP family intramembrane metalloprotease [Microbacterium sp. MAH-37]